MSSPSVALVVAIAHGRVIGRDQDLPWRLREDLRRFKSITHGHAVLMGRRTFESIGRPLPGRHNIVLTGNRDFTADGVTVAHSFEEALEAANDAQVFVIGGAGVYETALAHADTLHVTEVHANVDGDTFFPEVDWASWSLCGHESVERDEHNDYPVSFLTFRRPD